MGSNTDATTAVLELAIREKVHLHAEYGGHGYESDAWLAIKRWEDWTGREWTGERPEPPRGGAA